MSARFGALSLIILAPTAVLLSGSPSVWAEQLPLQRVAGATSPQQAIRQALSKTVDVKCVEMPLADVANSLAKVVGKPVRIDHLALSHVGLDDKWPVTARIANISARSALELILGPLGLTWVFDRETVLITTLEEFGARLERKRYDVADLLVQGSGSSRFNAKPLTRAITACVAPRSWSSVGGNGTIEARPGTAGNSVLEVTQTQQAHEDIETLLADLRGARGERPQEGPRADRRPSGIEQKRRAARQVIRRALAKSIKLDFQETPLDDVVKYLNQKAGFPILIDHKALDDVGLGSEVPITARVSDIKLRSALDYMLRPLDLTWTIAHEVLLITTPEEAETAQRTQVYEVSDLPTYRNEQGEGVPDYDGLIDMIEACIDPTSWNYVGGPGSIVAVDAPGIQVLVVSQAREGHEAVEALLDKLRGLRRKEPVNGGRSRLPPADRPKTSCIHHAPRDAALQPEVFI